MYSFSPNGLLEFSHITALDGATKFTVSMIANFKSSTTNWSALLGQIGTASGTGNILGFGFLRREGTQNIYCAIRNGSDNGGVEFAHAFNDVQKHIMIAYDGTQSGTDRIRAYVDSTLQTTFAFFGNVDAAVGITNQPLTVASSEGGLYGNVDMAELAIWSGVAFGQAQASMLAASTNPMALNPRPDFYADLVREAKDLVGGKIGTNTGGTVISHPRIYHG